MKTKKTAHDNGMEILAAGWAEDDRKSEALTAARLMGVIAGRARYQKDEARARFETDYFRRFCATYPKDWRAEFDAAFKDGYQEEARPRGPIAL